MIDKPLTPAQRNFTERVLKCVGQIYKDIAVEALGEEEFMKRVNLKLRDISMCGTK